MTILNLPARPLPADVDLRDFQFMPLDVVRLRDSEMAAVADAEVFRCAVLLWSYAWHQVPAGSVPADDATLARAVGLGRDVKGWLKLKAQVLRGFGAFEGRYYHRVVCEKAVDSWNERLEFRWRRECDRVRKENKNRAEKGEAPMEFPGKPVHAALEWPGEFQRKAPDFPAESGNHSDGNEKLSAGIPSENALKGQGKGRDSVRDRESISPPAPNGAGPPADGEHGSGGAQSEFGLTPPEPDSDAALFDAVTEWNQLAERIGLSRVANLTPPRKARLRLRLAECGGIEGWRTALKAVENSPFLRGVNDRKWKANFDFLLQQQSFTKLMEGAYGHDDDAQTGNRSAGGGSAMLAGIAAAVDSRSG